MKFRAFPGKICLGQKGIAFFLSLCLMVSQSGAEASAQGVSLNVGAIHELPLQLPREYGILEQSLPGSSGKTIFYIQDAHDSLEAQESIAKIVDHLVKHQGVKTVFEEGYEGPVPTDKYFGGIQDPVVREKVSYFYLDKLRLGGAEYAHINRRRDFKLIGVDTLKLHRKNLRSYRRSAALREDVEKDLDTLRLEMELLAARHFPKQFKEWRKLTENRGQSPQEGAVPFFHGRKIFRILEGLELLKRLQQIEVTQEEYESIVGARFPRPETKGGVTPPLRQFTTEGLADFIVENTGQSIYLSKRWERKIRKAVEFYETAFARDRNLEKHLDQFLADPEEKSAVLVFGGFHKKEIVNLLKQKGIACRVIFPHFTEINPRHQEYYKRLMSLGRHPYEIPAHVRRAARAESRLQIWDRLPLDSARAELRVLEKVVRESSLLERPLLLREMERALKGEGREHLNQEVKSEVRIGNQEAEIKEARKIFERRVLTAIGLAAAAVLIPKALGWSGPADVWAAVAKWGYPSFPAGTMLTAGITGMTTGILADRYSMFLTKNRTYRHKPVRRALSFGPSRFLLGVVTEVINFYLLDFFFPGAVLARFMISAVLGILNSSVVSVFVNGPLNRKAVKSMQAAGEMETEEARDLLRKFSTPYQIVKTIEGILIRLPLVLLMHDVAQNVVPEAWRNPVIFVFGALFQLYVNFKANKEDSGVSLSRFFKFNLPAPFLVYFLGGTFPALVSSLGAAFVISLLLKYFWNPGGWIPFPAYFIRVFGAPDVESSKPLPRSEARLHLNSGARARGIGRKAERVKGEEEVRSRKEYLQDPVFAEAYDLWRLLKGSQELRPSLQKFKNFGGIYSMVLTLTDVPASKYDCPAKAAGIYEALINPVGNEDLKKRTARDHPRIISLKYAIENVLQHGLRSDQDRGVALLVVGKKNVYIIVADSGKGMNIRNALSGEERGKGTFGGWGLQLFYITGYFSGGEVKIFSKKQLFIRNDQTSKDGEIVSFDKEEVQGVLWMARIPRQKTSRSEARTLEALGEIKWTPEVEEGLAKATVRLARKLKRADAKAFILSGHSAKMSKRLIVAAWTTLYPGEKPPVIKVFSPQANRVFWARSFKNERKLMKTIDHFVRTEHPLLRNLPSDGVFYLDDNTIDGFKYRDLKRNLRRYGKEYGIPGLQNLRMAELVSDPGVRWMRGDFSGVRDQELAGTMYWLSQTMHSRSDKVRARVRVYLAGLLQKIKETKKTVTVTDRSGRQAPPRSEARGERRGIMVPKRLDRSPPQAGTEAWENALWNRDAAGEIETRWRTVFENGSLSEGAFNLLRTPASAEWGRTFNPELMFEMRAFSRGYEHWDDGHKGKTGDGHLFKSKLKQEELGLDRYAGTMRLLLNYAAWKKAGYSLEEGMGKKLSEVLDAFRGTEKDTRELVRLFKRNPQLEKAFLEVSYHYFEILKDAMRLRPNFPSHLSGIWRETEYPYFVDYYRQILEEMEKQGLLKKGEADRRVLDTALVLEFQKYTIPDFGPVRFHKKEEEEGKEAKLLTGKELLAKKISDVDLLLNVLFSEPSFWTQKRVDFIYRLLSASRLSGILEAEEVWNYFRRQFLRKFQAQRTRSFPVSRASPKGLSFFLKNLPDSRKIYILKNAGDRKIPERLFVLYETDLQREFYQEEEFYPALRDHLAAKLWDWAGQYPYARFFDRSNISRLLYQLKSGMKDPDHWRLVISAQGNLEAVAIYNPEERNLMFIESAPWNRSASFNALYRKEKIAADRKNAVWFKDLKELSPRKLEGVGSALLFFMFREFGFRSNSRPEEIHFSMWQPNKFTRRLFDKKNPTTGKRRSVKWGFDPRQVDLPDTIPEGIESKRIIRDFIARKERQQKSLRKAYEQMGNGGQARRSEARSEAGPSWFTRINWEQVMEKRVAGNLNGVAIARMIDALREKIGNRGFLDARQFTQWLRQPENKIAGIGNTAAKWLAEDAFEYLGKLQAVKTQSEPAQLMHLQLNVSSVEAQFPDASRSGGKETAEVDRAAFDRVLDGAYALKLLQKANTLPAGFSNWLKDQPEILGVLLGVFNIAVTREALSHEHLEEMEPLVHRINVMINTSLEVQVLTDERLLIYDRELIRNQALSGGLDGYLGIYDSTQREAMKADTGLDLFIFLDIIREQGFFWDQISEFSAEDAQRLRASLELANQVLSGESPPRQIKNPILNLAFPTARNADALEKSMRSYLNSIRDFGHAFPNVWVFDDSTGETAAEKRKRVVALALELGIAIRYMGEEEKEAFLKGLLQDPRIQAHGLTREDLIRIYFQPKKLGSNRNFIQTYFSGEIYSTVDDDSYAEVTVDRLRLPLKISPQFMAVGDRVLWEAQEDQDIKTLIAQHPDQFSEWLEVYQKYKRIGHFHLMLHQELLKVLEHHFKDPIDLNKKLAQWIHRAVGGTLDEHRSSLGEEKKIMPDAIELPREIQQDLNLPVDIYGIHGRTIGRNAGDLGGVHTYEYDAKRGIVLGETPIQGHIAFVSTIPNLHGAGSATNDLNAFTASGDPDYLTGYRGDGNNYHHLWNVAADRFKLLTTTMTTVDNRLSRGHVVPSSHDSHPLGRAIQQADGSLKGFFTKVTVNHIRKTSRTGEGVMLRPEQTSEMIRNYLDGRAVEDASQIYYEGLSFEHGVFDLAHEITEMHEKLLGVQGKTKLESKKLQVKISPAGRRAAELLDAALREALGGYAFPTERQIMTKSEVVRFDQGTHSHPGSFLNGGSAFSQSEILRNVKSEDFATAYLANPEVRQRIEALINAYLEKIKELEQYSRDLHKAGKQMRQTAKEIAEIEIGDSHLAANQQSAINNLQSQESRSEARGRNLEELQRLLDGAVLVFPDADAVLKDASRGKIFPEMARRLSEHPSGSDIYEKARAVLREDKDIDSPAYLFLEGFDPQSPSTLQLIYSAFVFETALYEVLKAQMGASFRPAAFFGNSMGQFAALVAAGAVNFEEMAHYVIRVSELFSESQKREGDRLQFLQILGPGLQDSTVRQNLLNWIAGKTQDHERSLAVDGGEFLLMAVYRKEDTSSDFETLLHRLAEEIKEKGNASAKLIARPDRSPYKIPHHPFNPGIREAIRRAADQLSINVPSVPVISFSQNSTAGDHRLLNPAAIRSELAEGFYETLWLGSALESASRAGLAAVETGFGSALSQGMGKRFPSKPAAALDGFFEPLISSRSEARGNGLQIVRILEQILSEIAGRIAPFKTPGPDSRSELRKGKKSVLKIRGNALGNHSEAEPPPWYRPPYGRFFIKSYERLLANHFMDYKPISRRKNLSEVERLEGFIHFTKDMERNHIALMMALFLIESLFYEAPVFFGAFMLFNLLNLFPILFNRNNRIRAERILDRIEKREASSKHLPDRGRTLSRSEARSPLTLFGTTGSVRTPKNIPDRISQSQEHPWVRSASVEPKPRKGLALSASLKGRGRSLKKKAGWQSFSARGGAWNGSRSRGQRIRMQSAQKKSNKKPKFQPFSNPSSRLSSRRAAGLPTAGQHGDRPHHKRKDAHSNQIGFNIGHRFSSLSWGMIQYPSSHIKSAKLHPPIAIFQFGAWVAKLPMPATVAEYLATSINILPDSYLRVLSLIFISLRNQVSRAQGRWSQAFQSRLAKSETIITRRIESLYQSKSVTREWLKRKQLIPIPRLSPQLPRFSSVKNTWKWDVMAFILMSSTTYLIFMQLFLLIKIIIKNLGKPVKPVTVTDSRDTQARRPPDLGPDRAVARSEARGKELVSEYRGIDVSEKDGGAVFSSTHPHAGSPTQESPRSEPRKEVQEEDGRGERDGERSSGQLFPRAKKGEFWWRAFYRVLGTKWYQRNFQPYFRLFSWHVKEGEKFQTKLDDFIRFSKEMEWIHILIGFSLFVLTAMTYTPSSPILGSVLMVLTILNIYPIISNRYNRFRAKNILKKLEGSNRSRNVPASIGRSEARGTAPLTRSESRASGVIYSPRNILRAWRSEVLKKLDARGGQPALVDDEIFGQDFAFVELGFELLRHEIAVPGFSMNQYFGETPGPLKPGDVVLVSYDERNIPNPWRKGPVASKSEKQDVLLNAKGGYVRYRLGVIDEKQWIWQDESTEPGKTVSSGWVVKGNSAPYKGDVLSKLKGDPDQPWRPVFADLPPWYPEHFQEVYVLRSGGRKVFLRFAPPLRSEARSVENEGLKDVEKSLPTLLGIVQGYEQSTIALQTELWNTIEMQSKRANELWRFFRPRLRAMPADRKRNIRQFIGEVSSEVDALRRIVHDEKGPIDEADRLIQQAQKLTRRHQRLEWFFAVFRIQRNSRDVVETLASIVQKLLKWSPLLHQLATLQREKSRRVSELLDRLEKLKKGIEAEEHYRSEARTGHWQGIRYFPVESLLENTPLWKKFLEMNRGAEIPKIYLQGSPAEVEEDFNRKKAGIPRKRIVYLALELSKEKGRTHHLVVVDKLEDILEGKVQRLGMLIKFAEPRIKDILDGHVGLNESLFAFSWIEDSEIKNIHIISISLGRGRDARQLQNHQFIWPVLGNIEAVFHSFFKGWTASAVIRRSTRLPYVFLGQYGFRPATEEEFQRIKGRGYEAIFEEEDFRDIVNQLAPGEPILQRNVLSLMNDRNHLMVTQIRDRPRSEARETDPWDSVRLLEALVAKGGVSDSRDLRAIDQILDDLAGNGFTSLTLNQILDRLTIYPFDKKYPVAKGLHTWAQMASQREKAEDFKKLLLAYGKIMEVLSRRDRIREVPYLFLFILMHLASFWRFMAASQSAGGEGAGYWMLIGSLTCLVAMGIVLKILLWIPLQIERRNQRIHAIAQTAGIGYLLKKGMSAAPPRSAGDAIQQEQVTVTDRSGRQAPPRSEARSPLTLFAPRRGSGRILSGVEGFGTTGSVRTPKNIPDRISQSQERPWVRSASVEPSTALAPREAVSKPRKKTQGHSELGAPRTDSPLQIRSPEDFSRIRDVVLGLEVLPGRPGKTSLDPRILIYFMSLLEQRNRVKGLFESKAKTSRWPDERRRGLEEYTYQYRLLAEWFSRRRRAVVKTLSVYHHLKNEKNLGLLKTFLEEFKSSIPKHGQLELALQDLFVSKPLDPKERKEIQRQENLFRKWHLTAAQAVFLEGISLRDLTQRLEILKQIFENSPQYGRVYFNPLRHAPLLTLPLDKSQTLRLERASREGNLEQQIKAELDPKFPVEESLFEPFESEEVRYWRNLQDELAYERRQILESAKKAESQRKLSQDPAEIKTRWRRFLTDLKAFDKADPTSVNVKALYRYHRRPVRIPREVITVNQSDYTGRGTHGTVKVNRVGHVDLLIYKNGNGGRKFRAIQSKDLLEAREGKKEFELVVDIQEQEGPQKKSKVRLIMREVGKYQPLFDADSDRDFVNLLDTRRMTGDFLGWFTGKTSQEPLDPMPRWVGARGMIHIFQLPPRTLHEQIHIAEEYRLTPEGKPRMLWLRTLRKGRIKKTTSHLRRDGPPVGSIEWSPRKKRYRNPLGPFFSDPSSTQRVGDTRAFGYWRKNQRNRFDVVGVFTAMGEGKKSSPAIHLFGTPQLRKFAINDKRFGYRQSVRVYGYGFDNRFEIEVRNNGDLGGNGDGKIVRYLHEDELRNPREELMKRFEDWDTVPPQALMVEAYAGERYLVVSREKWNKEIKIEMDKPRALPGEKHFVVFELDGQGRKAVRVFQVDANRVPVKELWHGYFDEKRKEMAAFAPEEEAAGFKRQMLAWAKFQAWRLLYNNTEMGRPEKLDLASLASIEKRFETNAKRFIEQTGTRRQKTGTVTDRTDRSGAQARRRSEARILLGQKGGLSASASGAGGNQGKATLRQKLERPKWLPLQTFYLPSFPLGVDENSGHQHDNAQDREPNSKDDGHLLEKRTRKAHRENRLPKISNVSGNELSGGFIKGNHTTRVSSSLLKSEARVRDNSQIINNNFQYNEYFQQASFRSELRYLSDMVSQTVDIGVLNRIYLEGDVRELRPGDYAHLADPDPELFGFKNDPWSLFFRRTKNFLLMLMMARGLWGTVTVDDERISLESLLTRYRNSWIGDRIEGRNIPKSLLVKPKKREEYYLLVLPFESRYDPAKVKNLIGGPFEFVSPDKVQEVTGFAPGLVPVIPFSKTPVRVVWDKTFEDPSISFFAVPFGVPGNRLIAEKENIRRTVEDSGIHTFQYADILSRSEARSWGAAVLMLKTGSGDPGSLVDLTVAALEGKIGYRILPELETPEEIVALAPLDAETRVLTVGGATIPFLFLERAKAVEVVDINPKQLEFAASIAEIIEDGKGREELERMLLEGFLPFLRPPAFHRNVRNAVLKAVKSNYAFMTDPKRSEPLKGKIPQISFYHGDILRHKPKQRPDLVFYSTLPSLWNRNEPYKIFSLRQHMREQLRQGASVMFTVLDEKDAAGLKEYLAEGKVIKHPSASEPSISYYLVTPKKISSAPPNKRSEARLNPADSSTASASQTMAMSEARMPEKLFRVFPRRKWIVLGTTVVFGLIFFLWQRPFRQRQGRSTALVSAALSSGDSARTYSKVFLQEEAGVNPGDVLFLRFPKPEARTYALEIKIVQSVLGANGKREEVIFEKKVREEELKRYIEFPITQRGHLKEISISSPAPEFPSDWKFLSEAVSRMAVAKYNHEIKQWRLLKPEAFQFELILDQETPAGEAKASSRSEVRKRDKTERILESSRRQKTETANFKVEKVKFAGRRWTRVRPYEFDADLFRKFAGGFLKDPETVQAVAAEMGLDPAVKWSIRYRISSRISDGRHRDVVRLEVSAQSPQTSRRCVFALKLVIPYRGRDKLGKGKIERELEISRKFHRVPFFKKHFSTHIHFKGFDIPETVRYRGPRGRGYFQLATWKKGEFVYQFVDRVMGTKGMSRQAKRRLIQKFLLQVISIFLKGWDTLRLKGGGLVYGTNVTDILIHIPDRQAPMREQIESAEISYVDPEGGEWVGGYLSVLEAIDSLLSNLEDLPAFTITSRQFLDVIFRALGLVKGRKFLARIENNSSLGSEETSSLFAKALEGNLRKRVKEFLVRNQVTGVRRGSTQARPRSEARKSAEDLVREMTGLQDELRSLDPGRIEALVIKDPEAEMSRIETMVRSLKEFYSETAREIERLSQGPERWQHKALIHQAVDSLEKVMPAEEKWLSGVEEALGKASKNSEESRMLSEIDNGLRFHLYTASWTGVVAITNAALNFYDDRKYADSLRGRVDRLIGGEKDRAASPLHPLLGVENQTVIRSEARISRIKLPANIQEITEWNAARARVLIRKRINQLAATGKLPERMRNLPDRKIRFLARGFFWVVMEVADWPKNARISPRVYKYRLRNPKSGKPLLVPLPRVYGDQRSVEELVRAIDEKEPAVSTGGISLAPKELTKELKAGPDEAVVEQDRGKAAQELLRETMNQPLGPERIRTENMIWNSQIRLMHTLLKKGFLMADLNLPNIVFPVSAAGILDPHGRISDFDFIYEFNPDGTLSYNPRIDLLDEEHLMANFYLFLQVFVVHRHDSQEAGMRRRFVLAARKQGLGLKSILDLLENPRWPEIAEVFSVYPLLSWERKEKPVLSQEDVQHAVRNLKRIVPDFFTRLRSEILSYSARRLPARKKPVEKSVTVTNQNNRRGTQARRRSETRKDLNVSRGGRVSEDRRIGVTGKQRARKISVTPAPRSSDTLFYLRQKRIFAEFEEVKRFSEAQIEEMLYLAEEGGADFKIVVSGVDVLDPLGKFLIRTSGRIPNLAAEKIGMEESVRRHTAGFSGEVVYLSGWRKTKMVPKMVTVTGNGDSHRSGGHTEKGDSHQLGGHTRPSVSIAHRGRRAGALAQGLVDIQELLKGSEEWRPEYFGQDSEGRFYIRTASASILHGWQRLYHQNVVFKRAA